MVSINELSATFLRVESETWEAELLKTLPGIGRAGFLMHISANDGAFSVTCCMSSAQNKSTRCWAYLSEGDTDLAKNFDSLG